MKLTINSFLEQAVAKHGPDPALEFGTEVITYDQLSTRAASIAGALHHAGVKRGDRVAFLLRNRPEIVELLLGISSIGGIAVPMNFRFVGREVLHVLTDSTPDIVVFEAGLAETVDAARADHDRAVTYVVLGEGPDWAIPYDEWIASGAGVASLPHTASAEDPFFFAYTSGTTGAPKAAVVSHGGLARNALSLMLEYGAPSESRSRFLTLMPMFHSNSTWFAICCIMAGATNVIDTSRSFDPNTVLRTISSRSITHTSVVPTMLKRLVDVGRDLGSEIDLSNLEWFLCGSAPISLALKNEVEDVFRVRVSEGYGSTETGLVSSLRMSDPDTKKASVGQATIGTEIEVRDTAGNPCPTGTVGEVHTRGENVLLDRYWNNPTATGKALGPAGWLTVGDMGYVDEDGYLFLTDRKNDVIITGGENVYPSEVEGVLLTHPAVLEAAVVPKPDEEWGETVRAVVSTRHPVGTAELVAYCREQLAGYKVPRQIEFVDELPKNATGKILRRLVRDNA